MRKRYNWLGYGISKINNKNKNNMNIIKKINTISAMIIINDIQYIIFSKQDACIYNKIIHVGKTPILVALLYDQGNWSSDL